LRFSCAAQQKTLELQPQSDAAAVIPEEEKKQSL
jgi:hypothetical protein